MASTENHNPSIQDYSECSGDSDLAILPPPRRSPVSRLSPRRFNGALNMMMLKWTMCLFGIYLLLHCVPRNRQTIENSNRDTELAILLWNIEDNENHCPCMVTSNRSYINGNIDAVVVNVDRAYSLEGLEEIRHTPYFLLVFAARYPLSLAQNPIEMHGQTAFNFTMSYRLDSDIIWTDYYFSTPQTIHKRVQQFVAWNTTNKLAKKEASELHLKLKLKLKRQLAAYMMYEVNQYTQFQSVYLKELRNHMELDSIKTCSELNRCLPYKFMLVFEPNSCPDYVHPHFYMALKNFMVPVLISRFQSNISHLVPHGSYIKAEDFDEPERLAKHLKMISAQPEVYERFFWWHSNYQLHQIRQPYCILCRHLGELRQQRQTDYFPQWWTRNTCPNTTDKLA